ncbi:MAG: lactate dehydrogenase [SAR202 cluster bacterium]|nr:lactate dehydrogenase [SAR202 cluster bacterium]
MPSINVAFLANPKSNEIVSRFKVMKDLAPAGVTVRLVDSTASEGELIEQLADIDALIPAVGGKFPISTAQHARRLKLIQLMSAGFDVLDVPGLNKLGIQVANNGGSNAISVSEHTISLMLSVYRRLMDSWDTTRQGKWREGLEKLPLRHEINGKTVGIIGFGNIGRQVARRLQGWDVDILYHDVVELVPGRDRELGATRASLDELLRRSDIVTLHVPLNGSTRGMLSDREFGLMKPTAVVINACRGPVIDEAALIRALKKGRPAAAGLDVLEQEPTDPNNPLLRMSNVVVTPHWAGGTVEGNERAVRFAMSNFLRLAESRPLLSIVTPED